MVIRILYTLGRLVVRVRAEGREGCRSMPDNIKMGPFSALLTPLTTWLADCSPSLDYYVALPLGPSREPFRVATTAALAAAPDAAATVDCRRLPSNFLNRFISRIPSASFPRRPPNLPLRLSVLGDASRAAVLPGISGIATSSSGMSFTCSWRW